MRESAESTMTLTAYLNSNSNVLEGCGSCSGWRLIVSGAVHDIGKISRVAAIIIPWHACRTCRRAAEAEFEKACKEPQLDYVYLARYGAG